MESQSTETEKLSPAGTVRLHRTLGLWPLIVIGMVVTSTPTAPMGLYGIISNKAQGHVVTTILIAMVAMLLTAISYGRMACVYPSAGSAYTYVGREIHSSCGYIVGWGMVLEFILNPLICTAFCAKITMNILPGLSYYVWILIFAALFTGLNLLGIKTSARMNEALCAVMALVVLLFLGYVIRLLGQTHHQPEFFIRPFYQRETFHLSNIFAGTSIAIFTYIGFDAVSTLSEEAENPRRNVLLATVLVCVITGLFSGFEVYAAQLVWGSKPFAVDRVESAFSIVAQQAGGPLLFQVINSTLLLATIGSGMSAQLAAGRLLYGMGRGNAIPKGFFGAIEPKHRIPRNNIVLVGAFAFAGAALLEFFAHLLGGGAYEIGSQALVFGAFIAFMGVNAAAFVRYWIRGKDRGWSSFLVPVLGFFICGFIWLNLGHPALLLGTAWMVAGIVYGAIRTQGFRAGLVNFDIPPDEA